MCRALAYIGPPVPLSDLLHAPDNGLVAQSYDPKQLHMLNLAGFGMISWSSQVDEPLVYRSTLVPVYDTNLASLARHVRGECVIGHVRGIPYREDAGFGPENLHPFRYPDAPVVLAHNGELDGFSRMRVALAERVRPEVAVHMRGTTDSEWIYALLLSHLKEEKGSGAEEVLSALTATIGTLREVRAQLGIDTSSSMNLFLAGEDYVIAVRYTFDFGRYSLDVGRMHEANAQYLSLWFTLGDHVASWDGGFSMAPDDGAPRALVAASEPLSSDPSAWVEVPEYGGVLAIRVEEGLNIQTVELA